MEQVNITFLDIPTTLKALYGLMGIDIPKLSKPEYGFGINTIVKNIVPTAAFEESFPKKNLADLPTVDFLHLLAGDVHYDEECILINDKIYHWKVSFASNWRNIIKFCDTIYEDIEKVYTFVTEGDYIILFPKLRKMSLYTHNNWHAQICFPTPVR